MQDRVTQVQIVNRMIEAGESEEDIAAVIRQFKSEPVEPLKKDSFLTALGRTIVPTPFGAQIPLKRVMQAAPAAGAGAAVAMSGGTAAVPLMALAGAGGAAGQAASDAVSGEELSGRDRLVNMGEAAAWQAAGQGAGNLVPWVAGKMASGARSLWNKAAKITEPVARKTQTMRAGGSLQEGKDEIAETVLSRGIGTLRQGNVASLKSEMNLIDDEIDRVVAGSTGLVNRQDLRRALQAGRDSIVKGSQEAEERIAAYTQSLRLLGRLPAKMPVKTAQALKRQIYQTYEGTYPASAAESMKAVAEKTTARAAKEAVAKAEPDVADMNQRMSKLVPAKSAMDKAVGRTSNHNPVGLTQMMAGMVPKTSTVVAALLNHPKVGSFAAQQLYNAAAKLPKDARTAGNIIRMAETLLIAGRND